MTEIVTAGPGIGTGTRTLLIATALACAAVGGVFFAFSTFVMSGLGKAPARSGLEAMQGINLAAPTPAFMTLLFGAAALCVGSGVVAVVSWGDRRAALMLAGAVLYLLGTIVLTVAYHVPRNDALAALDPSAASSPTAWSEYHRTWTLANHVRTLASLAAALCFLLAL